MILFVKSSKPGQQKNSYLMLNFAQENDKCGGPLSILVFIHPPKTCSRRVACTLQVPTGSVVLKAKVSKVIHHLKEARLIRSFEKLKRGWRCNHTLICRVCGFCFWVGDQQTTKKWRMCVFLYMCCWQRREGLHLQTLHRLDLKMMGDLRIDKPTIWWIFMNLLSIYSSCPPGCHMLQIQV